MLDDSTQSKSQGPYPLPYPKNKSFFLKVSHSLPVFHTASMSSLASPTCVMPVISTLSHAYDASGPPRVACTHPGYTWLRADSSSACSASAAAATSGDGRQCGSTSENLFGPVGGRIRLLSQSRDKLAILARMVK